MWFSLALFKLTPLGVVADLPHDVAFSITFALLVFFLAFPLVGHSQERQASPRSVTP
jgi:hypothetical protein